MPRLPPAPILVPISLPHGAEGDLSSLPSSFSGFSVPWTHSQLPASADGVPTLPCFSFAAVKGFLSVLLNTQRVPTPGLCICFLCLECASFCFSHDCIFSSFRSWLKCHFLTRARPNRAVWSWFPLLIPIFATPVLPSPCCNCWLFYLFPWFLVASVPYSVTHREDRAGVCLSLFAELGPKPGGVSVVCCLNSLSAAAI